MPLSGHLVSINIFIIKSVFYSGSQTDVKIVAKMTLQVGKFIGLILQALIIQTERIGSDYVRNAMQYSMIGYPMPSSYRLTLEKFLSELDVKAEKVLGIGDAQKPTKGRTKSWDVKEYLIADLPQPHADSPKPDIELDLNTTPMVSDDYGEYDLIFCLEVMDYIFNPIDAFRRMKSLLKSGGIAWLSFPSQYPLHQPVEDDALRYMPGGIKKLARSVGLEIIQMIPRRTETDAIYRAFRAERMRCAKHEDHNISGWIVGFRK
jgi:SAM-dependent methyltransferase